MRGPLTARDVLREPSSTPILEDLGRHLDADCAGELLRAAGQGDEAAFGVLFDWTAPVIFGCLRRALSGPGEAELVAEKVYVRLWRDAPRFSGSRRTAHRHLLDVTRCELVRWHRGQRVHRSTGRAPTLRAHHH